MDYGIDVSHWNAIADADAVRANGISYAWVKATEGTTYEDPTFQLKVGQLRQAGIVVGAYHFLNGENPRDQANHFARVANLVGCLGPAALLPMLDMEASDARGNANYLVNEFYDALVVASAIVYGNKDWWENVLRPGDWAGRDLLLQIARYNGDPGNPGVDGAFAVHQHTSKGTVPGIPGNVDRDATVGSYTLDSLVLGGAGMPRPFPGPSYPAPVIPAGDDWTVRPGDTLSRIASAWGVTVSALAAANQIPNPDLIFPNPVIHGPESAGAAPAPAPGPVYTIVPGDTLSGIAARTGTTVAVLATLNHISNPDRIYAGDELQLPAASAVPIHPEPAGVERIYVVQRGDTLSQIAAQLEYPGGYPALAARNNIANPNLIFPGQEIHY